MTRNYLVDNHVIIVIIIICIYIYLGKFHHDLTATSLGIMVRIRGIIPEWPEFRLVKYYNLPIYIYAYGLVIILLSPCLSLFMFIINHRYTTIQSYTYV